uniref:prophage tail fiber N-terminal domain-containing protein n=1 Tax=Escherichia coli TaxID=562 RepID=UPI002023B9A6
MAVKISGVLKDGTGKPVENCTIQLKARRTSSTVETALGVEVTKVKPVTRTITSANIDRLRVTFGVQSLLETTSKGDRNPSSVRLLI